MNTDTLYNKIEAYLRQDMDENEKFQFQQQIEGDPKLALEVEKHRKAEMVLQYAFRQRMKNRLTEIDKDQENTSGGATAKRFFLGKKWAAAASLLLIVGLGSHFWVNSQFSNAAIADSFYYETEQETRGGTDTFENSPYEVLGQAEEAYNTADYQSAISLLQELMQGKTTLVETAQLNLAMAYLKAGQKANSQKVIGDIVAQPSHQFYPEALKLQKKLNGAAYKYAN